MVNSAVLRRPSVEEMEAKLSAKVVSLVFPALQQEAAKTDFTETGVAMPRSKVEVPLILAITSGGCQRPPSVTWGKKPRPLVSRDTIKHQSIINRSQSIAHAARPRSLIPKRSPKDALVPIPLGGKFYTTEELLTGKPSTDAKIATVFEFFATINTILEAKHMSALAARISGGVDLVSNAAVKNLIGETRALMFKIRQEVVEEKGPYIKEPLSYWRKRFELAII